MTQTQMSSTFQLTAIKNTTADVSVDSNVNTNNSSVNTTLDDTNLSELSELFQRPEQIDWNRLINLDKSDLIK